MSGLRSQREYTITCVSLRSGIASSGMCVIDHVPPATAAPTRRKIRNLLRAENSMMRLIMLMFPGTCGVSRVRRSGGRLLELALRIDQEVARSYDPLPRLKAAQNLHAITQPFAGLHLARLEISISAIHEHGLTDAGVEHGFGGHCQFALGRNLELDVHEH